MVNDIILKTMDSCSVLDEDPRIYPSYSKHMWLLDKKLQLTIAHTQGYLTT